MTTDEKNKAFKTMLARCRDDAQRVQFLLATVDLANDEAADAVASVELVSSELQIARGVLAGLTSWPCEGLGQPAGECKVTLGMVTEADAEDQKAGDGHGIWCCGRCWALTMDLLTAVRAERDDAVLKLGRLTKFLAAKTTPEEEAYEQAEIQKIRAVAMEEAARYVGLHWTAASTAQQFADDLRNLAPLQPSLVVVEREKLSEAFHLAWANGRRTQRAHSTEDFVPLYALLGPAK